MSGGAAKTSPFPKADAETDLSVVRGWIRGLPPLPSRIRYLDEYDDTWDCPGPVDTDDAFARGVRLCPRPIPRIHLSSAVK